MAGWERVARRMAGVAAVVGIVLTVPWGMLPVHAATTDSGTTTVSFNIAEAIEVTAWPAATFSLADAGAPGVSVVSDVMTVSVRSNTSWGLQVHSDTDEGMMREFDSGTSTYVAGGVSVGPVEWATNANGPWTPLSSVPAAMFADQPTTGEGGANAGFLLRVTPSFDDEPLPEGREYRIVLVYTAGVGF